ncbi:hypothetical protein GSS88_05565 [Corynebacterium sp. 3HC-13]|uniref:hypothetical protein n=1 Tax=Corynebacterium poyangense TaxID=2684405 RepID=UPI001CCE861A|nr:hypothetical protein [Corynebacterium poyangense]MBZ8177267.1 hypothetical protein [Corynebacterium poyangense]
MPIRRFCALLGISALSAAFGTLSLDLTLTAAPAQAQGVAVPLDITNPSVAVQWDNPALRSDDRQSFVSMELESLPQSLSNPGDGLRFHVKLRNNGEERISNINVVLRRGEAQHSAAEMRRIMALNAGAYTAAHYQAPVDFSLEPGESREFWVEAPTNSDQPGSFPIKDPGIYPIFFGLDGTTNHTGTVQLTSQRFLLSAGPLGGTNTNPGQPSAEETHDAEESATSSEVSGTGLSLVLPLSAYVDIIPGETGEAPGDTPLVLYSDDLADQLSAGGRLGELLKTYKTYLQGKNNPIRSSACLAIDPALLDAVHRMTKGYTVANSRPAIETSGQRLRDSWNSHNSQSGEHPGSGSAAAQQWLDELTSLASNTCVVSLPWANTDLNAVAASNNPWLMREALGRGPELISSILNTSTVENVVIPGNGYITPATVRSLGWATSGSAQSVTDFSTKIEKDFEAEAQRRGTQNSQDSETSLNDENMPSSAPLAPPVPSLENAVSVLVAGNTVWDSDRVDRFTQLAPGIRAVSYHASLAASLGETGEHPDTPAYANPDARYDARLDSPAARDSIAAGALAMSLTETSNQSQQHSGPVLMMPPAELSTSTAESILQTAASLYASGRAESLSLSDYLTPDPQQAAALNATPEAADNAPPTAEVGSPYPDPGIISDTEILQASREAGFSDDLTRLLSNDPTIALTRYAFTAPLRQEVLRTLSVCDRHAASTYQAAVQRTGDRLKENRERLLALGRAVTLIPPGGVYTRTSDSSPLLVVAENRLPLPVETVVQYRAPSGVTLQTPGSVRIPASGSITVQLTPKIPPEHDRTQLQLWLSTGDGAAISSPVDITVQNRANFFSTSGLALIVLSALALILVFRVGRHSKRLKHGGVSHPAAAPFRPHYPDNEQNGPREPY